jgi:hypothetical protein
MTNAEKVAEIGVALYGDDWTRGLARLADLSRRTVQRVRASALEGEENDQAHGVLAAVYDRLHEIAPVEIVVTTEGYGGGPYP